jgi:hypothetical protein
MTGLKLLFAHSGDEVHLPEVTRTLYPTRTPERHVRSVDLFPMTGAFVSVHSIQSSLSESVSENIH